MVKFQFLAQFLVDNLSHPFESSHIALLRKFSTFANLLLSLLLMYDNLPVYPLSVIDNSKKTWLCSIGKSTYQRETPRSNQQSKSGQRWFLAAGNM